MDRRGADDYDLTIPLSRTVRLDGRVVTIRMPEWSHLKGRSHEVRIRLDSEPALLGMILEGTV